LNSFLNAHKALLITILLSANVVLLVFTVHIKQRSSLVAETYIDMNSDELITEEEIEELERLEDLLKSFDNITTNQAYNETNKNQEAEDEEFEKQLEEIRNRNNDESQKEIKTAEEEPIPEENPAFDEINDIIKKRSEKNRDSSNKNSSIFYSLVDRSYAYLPTPVYLCEFGGKIVINITVNSEGEVIDANVNRASTSTNGCLIDSALEYARSSQFNSDPSKPTQMGTITFLFKGKH